MGLGRVDENKRDIIVKGTEMKAPWLLDKFKFLGCKQICFIDEPILSGFGASTYVSLHCADVVHYLNAVIKAIRKENHPALAMPSLF